MWDLRLTCAVLAAFSALGTRAWTPASFPDPYLDPQACGIEGGNETTSWVCDPDHVLEPESRNRIEGSIQGIAQGEPPYVKVPCSADGEEVGFQLGVAVMRSYRNKLLAQGDPSSVVGYFGRQLHDRWSWGPLQCNNSVLFLLSVEDRQMDISRGFLAANASGLTHNAIGKILEKLIPLVRTGRYDDAVAKAVADIGLALAAGPPPPAKKKVDNVTGFAVLLVAVMAACLAIYVFVLPSGHSQELQYLQCKVKLEELARGQERLQAGQAFDPTSCPICLEDFDDAATVAAGGAQANGSTASCKAVALPCMHHFCEACATAWAQHNAACPICRHPIREPMGSIRVGSALQPQLSTASSLGQQPSEGQPVSSEQEQDPFFWCYGASYQGSQDARYTQRGYLREDRTRDELLFRLATLRRRYPQYVDDWMLQQWSDDLAAGRESSAGAWQLFQQRDPGMRAALAVRQKWVPASVHLNHAHPM